MSSLKKIAYTLSIGLITLQLINCSKDGDSSQPNPPDPNVIPKELAVDSVQVFDQTPTGRAESDRLGLSFSRTDFQPTGVYVKPNTSLKINLKLLQGSKLPQLLVGTHSHHTNWNHEPDTYPLQEGNNTVNVTNGGMVYVRYTDQGTSGSKAELKFLDGWNHTPYYRLGKTTNANWKKMLDRFKDVPTVTLISEKAFLVVTRQKAIVHQDENQDELLKAFDGVIGLYNDLSGMDSEKPVHKPSTLKLMFVEYKGSDYYMFAYNYRTAYSESGVRYILSEKDFKEEGWGPWHEIGHMYQMNDWTWGHLGEVTVNIYSLAAERSMGITTSRIKRDNVWANISTYLALPDAQRDFNTDAANVWVRLGMFYQLHLAFGEDFYKKLHKNIREENPPNSSNEDKMKTFMIHACKTADKDLTDFFKKWGLKFNGSDAVYTEIQALGLSAPAQDLTTLQD